MQIFDDAITFVSQHPERFLTPGFPKAIDLATRVLADVLILGGLEACVIRYDTWWIVGSNVDWLSSGSDISIRDRFMRIVPLPQAGQNAMRAEVLLVAFCESEAGYSLSLANLGSSVRLSWYG